MTKAWYGINYTKCEEDCKHTLVETLRPKLTGIEIQNKKMDATAKLEIKLAPGAENIIVYRQTEMKCDATFTYGIAPPPKALNSKQAGAPMGSGMMARASANVAGIGMSYADF